MALKCVQMSPNDLELEEGLKDIGNKLASPPSDLQQLLLLLDKAENLFSRVEQSPTASMLVVLRPAMKALIAKELMGHSDMDVKVAIASCLSEITRITAPDAPYDDDLMKEIFGLIVGSFKNLDDMSSRSFPKRVSILETVAKVRSCVLMLDLDCDDLILEMFHHFLKTIRSKHSDTVFSSMETVMTLVLEEAESISTRLLLCILDCLKLAESNILPAAKKLAEKVLINCSLKLKPCLGELFNDSSALLSDYSKVVAAVLQGNLVTSMQNGTNASSEIMVDDQKLSGRTLSDNLPQGSAQLEGENFHPAIAVAAADKSSKSLMSDGSFQIGNGTAKPDSRSDLSSRKGVRNALLKLSINNDHYGVSNRKNARANSSQRKRGSKEAEISQANGPSTEVESAVCSKIEKKNVLELTSGSPNVMASVSMHNPNQHDGTRSRRSRLSQSSAKRNAVGEAAASSLTSAGHKEFFLTSEAKRLELPIGDLISNESEALGDSERKQITGSTKKSRSGSAKDGKGNAKDSKSTPTTNIGSDTTLPSNRGRNESQRKDRVNFSEKKQSTGTKKKKRVEHAEVDDKELKLKEMISSQKSRVKELVRDHNHVKDTNKTKSQCKRAPGIQEEMISSQKSRVKELVKDHNHVKDTNKTKSQCKHAPGIQEFAISGIMGVFLAQTSGPRKRRKGLDDTIVGSKIKIWWPDDQRFYDGIVDSFDQSTKMHKILYTDGDVEVLLLKKERWEFIEGETKMDVETDKPDVNASEILDSPGVSGLLPNHTARRRVKIHSDDVKSSSVTRKKSRNKLSEESLKANNQTEESTNKLEGDSPKISRRPKHGPSKFRGKVVEDASKKTHHKSSGDSGSSRKSKKIILTSMKKSMEGSSIPESAASNGKEGSPKPKSAEGRRKPGRMNQGAEGGKKPRMISNLNAKSRPSNSQLKLGKTDASPSGKKRKRGRLVK